MTTDKQLYNRGVGECSPRTQFQRGDQPESKRMRQVGRDVDAPAIRRACLRPRERGLPSTPSMRRLVIVKGGLRNFQLMGCSDRASIRTRWSSLRTRCSMKFDLAALLSLSRPLWAGRGLAVAANSVCPFSVVIPDPPLTQRGCLGPPLRFEDRQGARSCDPLSLLSVLRFRSARSRPGRAQRGEANP